MRKLTIKQLKDRLKTCSQTELIQLLTQLYKTDTVVEAYLNMEFADENYAEDLLAEKKNAMHKLFFPGRMRTMIPVREAKKIVSEFQKVCKEPCLVLDLQLYYVECGVAFANMYGDISESFCDSIDSVFWKVTETIKKIDSKEIYIRFVGRLKKVVADSDSIGWGLQDSLSEALASMAYDQE